MTSKHVHPLNSLRGAETSGEAVTGPRMHTGCLAFLTGQGAGRDVLLRGGDGLAGLMPDQQHEMLCELLVPKRP